jgi:hypothetical protein
VSEFNCVRCDVIVSGTDRRQHSLSAKHGDNGGSSMVVDDDYEVVAESPGTRGDPIDAETESVPRGMGQTK